MSRRQSQTATAGCYCSDLRAVRTPSAPKIDRPLRSESNGSGLAVPGRCRRVVVVPVVPTGGGVEGAAVVGSLTVEGGVVVGCAAGGGAIAGSDVVGSGVTGRADAVVVCAGAVVVCAGAVVVDDVDAVVIAAGCCELEVFSCSSLDTGFPLSSIRPTLAPRIDATRSASVVDSAFDSFIDSTD